MLRIQKLLSVVLIALAGCSGGDKATERSVADFMHMETAELKGIAQQCTTGVTVATDMTPDCLNAVHARSRRSNMDNRCWMNGVDHACVDAAGYIRK